MTEDEEIEKLENELEELIAENEELMVKVEAKFGEVSSSNLNYDNLHIWRNEDGMTAVSGFSRYILGLERKYYGRL